MPTSLLRAFDRWGVGPAAEIVAAGLQAQGLYVPFDGDGGKSPTRANLDDLTAHGIYYWWVWECSPTSPEGGAPSAEQDFARARAGFEGLGIPFPGVVYFANDAIVTDPGAVVAYYSEIAALARSVGSLGGAYANSTVIGWLEGITPRFWQTGAGSPSGPVPAAHIYQGAPSDEYGYPWFDAFGTTCDANGIFSTEAGLGNLNGPWPKPAPPPQEVPMAQPVFVRTVNGTYVQGAGGQLHLLNAEGVKVITDNKCDVLDDPTASVANAMGIAPGPAL